MLYYRGTSRNNPMSDWGHAMFTENIDRAYFTPGESGYGWTLDSTDCTPINDLHDIIIKAWEHDLDNGFTGDFGSDADISYYSTLTTQEVANSFDPADIIDSAEAWDSDLYIWFWERIAEPNGIMAISTQDGAVCFDAKLIKPYKED